MGLINVDYGVTIYGDTVLLRVDEVEDLEKIKAVFVKLANNNISRFYLSDIENVEFNNISDIVMTNMSKFIFIKKKRNIIYWEQSETDWYNCEGLIEGLIEGAKEKHGGHQYFNNESGIQIEISQNETFAGSNSTTITSTAARRRSSSRTEP